MIAALYTSGASADAANRPRELSTLVATEPAARNSGASTMIRVISVVCASASGPKPGVMSGTSWGANRSTSAASTASADSMRLDTVETTRHALASSSLARSAATIGISDEDRAPAATSWNRKSGIRNAALNGSSWAMSGTAAAIAMVRT